MLLAIPVVLTACSAAEPPSNTPKVATRLLAADDVGLISKAGSLRLEAALVLSSDDPRFGGFSGLWLAPDGVSLLAMSDRPSFWGFRLLTDDDGRLAGIGQAQVRVPEDAGRDWDAEALAPLPSGEIAVAHEGRHRIERRDRARLGLTGSTALPAVLDAEDNNGIEALATLPDGTLLALAEGIRGPDGEVRGWILEDGAAEPLSYVTNGGFVPTGAAVVGNHVLVLERSFALVQGGFGARVVSIPVSEVRPGARLEGAELFRLAPNVMDNFEAIAAHPAPDGRLWILLLTDDNQNAIQRTLLLQVSIGREDLD